MPCAGRDFPCLFLPRQPAFSRACFSGTDFLSLPYDDRTLRLQRRGVRDCPPCGCHARGIVCLPLRGRHDPFGCRHPYGAPYRRVAAQRDGDVTIAISTVLTDELIEEGFVREIISKVQTMRKENGFEVTDRITVFAQGNEKIVKLMQDNAETIKKITLADELVYDKLDGFTKEWNINGEKVTLGVK